MSPGREAARCGAPGFQLCRTKAGLVGSTRLIWTGKSSVLEAPDTQAQLDCLGLCVDGC